MELQAYKDTQKNPKVLRSNSIKIQNRNLHGGFSFRLNSKKFPFDFFGKDSILNHKHELIPNSFKQGPKTDRKRSVCEGNELIIDSLLPEGQITSFFKICHDSSETTDSTVLKNQRLSNETNIGVSDLQNIVAKQISTSIQLNEKYETNPDLCCTFSKIPISRSKFTTPEKKRPKNLEIVPDEQKNQSSQSVRVRRPLSKLQSRMFNAPVGRKNSIQKVFSLKSPTDSKDIKYEKSGKKIDVNDLFLPSIGKHHS